MNNFINSVLSRIDSKKLKALEKYNIKIKSEDNKIDSELEIEVSEWISNTEFNKLEHVFISKNCNMEIVFRAMFEYCGSCKSDPLECRYIEVEKFIEVISEIDDTYYFLVGCPDKEEKEYTCDLEYSDDIKNIYLEVKEILLMHDLISDKGIAEDKGQNEYRKLVNDVIQSDLAISNKIKNYIPTIPKCQIDTKDIEHSKFKENLEKFIKNEDFTEDKYIFEYNRKNNIVPVVFYKNNLDLIDIEENIGKNDIMFLSLSKETDLNKGILIDDIQKKYNDVDKLYSMIQKNMMSTQKKSQTVKKFPNVNDSDKKNILLNIIKFPFGLSELYKMYMPNVWRELSEKLKNLPEVDFENYLSLVIDDKLYCMPLNKNCSYFRNK